MSQAQTYIIDFSDLKQKREFLQQLGGLQNLHEIRIKRRMRHGTKEQRGYYRAAIIPAFVKALADQGQIVTDDECHEAFKHLFLRKSRQIKSADGEIKSIDFIDSSENVDIGEKSIFLEMCIGFLAEFFHVVVPPPEMYKA